MEPWINHAGGNMFSAFDLFTRGRSEWQVSTHAKPLIWEAGLDVAFSGNVMALLIVAVLTVWAYSTLPARRGKPGHQVLPDKRIEPTPSLSFCGDARSSDEDKKRLARVEYSSACDVVDHLNLGHD